MGLGLQKYGTSSNYQFSQVVSRRSKVAAPNSKIQKNSDNRQKTKEIPR
jgi:hypothetical protein